MANWSFDVLIFPSFPEIPKSIYRIYRNLVGSIAPMSGHVTALRYISFLSISAIVFLTLVVAAKTPGHWRDAVELDQLDTAKYSLWTVRGPSCGTKFDWKDG